MLTLAPFAVLLSLTVAAHAQNAPPNPSQASGTSFKSPVKVASGFVARVVSSNVTSPRSIAFDSHQNLVVVEKGVGVSLFSPAAKPASGWSKTALFANANLTHGIQVDGTKIYVTTGSDALVYNYNPATKAVNPSLPPYSIVSGLPADGAVLTHAVELERDCDGNAVALLISSGPLANVDITSRDPSSGLAQIRRFILPHQTSTYPPPSMTWLSGQLVAYGIRNSVGMSFSPSSGLPPHSPEQQLFVLDNGAELDDVKGITEAFANGNPADELDVINYSVFSDGSTSALGKFYGFPDFASLWNPTADPVGEPQFVGLRRGDQFNLHLNDTTCGNQVKNHAPVLNFEAHVAPLDIKFYTPPKSSANSGSAFPTNFGGDAFVSFHGSFDRATATGYGVVRVPFPLSHPAVSSALGYSFLIQAANLTSCPGTCIRPVGLSFSTDGKLYVSSDSSGELFVIEQGHT